MVKFSNSRPVVILLVEDNPADQSFTRRFFEESHLQNELYIVEDGVEALDYLLRRGKYADTSHSPRPDIILLDINMPRMDGKQALREIKSNPDLKLIPVIMLTTSGRKKDIFESYDFGVNSYIKKPIDPERFISMLHCIEHFWLVTVAHSPEPR